MAMTTYILEKLDTELTAKRERHIMISLKKANMLIIQNHGGRESQNTSQAIRYISRNLFTIQIKPKLTHQPINVLLTLSTI